MRHQLNCPSCGARDVPEAHLGRCQRSTEERAAAVAHGAAAQIPDVTTADLWAHLGHVGSFEDATRIVRQVVDLGWRPVVGSDPRRLWTRTPTVSGSREESAAGPEGLAPITPTTQETQ